MNSFAVILVGVLLLNIYALALILLRGPIYSTKVYRPMVWNIWLSVSPALVLLATLTALLIAAVLENAALVAASLAVGAAVWLLMLPNAAYLITELNFSHRRDDEDVPLWYDIVLVLTLALSGVANTLANVFLAHLIYAVVAFPNDDAPMAHASSWVMVAVMLLLVAFGIYLGRYLRFNSWDLRNPARFVRKFGAHFSERDHRFAALGFTLTHAILLGILYVLIVVPNIAYLM